MYSTPVDLSFSYLRFAVEASLDIKKDQVDRTGGDLRISPLIFKKIWNGPIGILWGWGETDSWKKTRSK
jgi:hypothetical protein